MHIRTRRHTIAALLSAAGLVAGGGVAAAQQTMALPGTDDSQQQVAVGVDGIATVTVDEADAGDSEVSGTITNDSDSTLSCGEVTVTDAALVDRNLAYLEGNLLPPAPPLPGVNPGSLDVMLGSGSLGSLGLGDPAAVELDAIQQAQDAARVAGHYGTADGQAIDAGEDLEWTAALAVPSDGGERTDFSAAAITVCTLDGQGYAVAGYEEDDDSNGNGGNGSLDLGSLDVGGSLGS